MHTMRKHPAFFKDGFYVCDYCESEFAVENEGCRHSEDIRIQNVDEKYFQTQEEDNSEENREESLEEFYSSIGWFDLFVIFFGDWLDLIIIIVPIVVIVSYITSCLGLL